MDLKELERAEIQYRKFREENTCLDKSWGVYDWQKYIDDYAIYNKPVLIKKDASELSGEYLAATGIYRDTADDIALRYKRLKEMVSDACVSLDSAETLRDGALRINRLREFANSLKNG